MAARSASALLWLLPVAILLTAPGQSYSNDVEDKIALLLEAVQSNAHHLGILRQASPQAHSGARSCLQLQELGESPSDGVYWFIGMEVPVYCDFSHDGGGWTLLLTTASSYGWDRESVRYRNHQAPALCENYSILKFANHIRDLGKGPRFSYRIEATAQYGRQRWGGVWSAPNAYSFLHGTNSQTDVRLLKKFDKWEYKDTGIEKRMPWLSSGPGEALLTTSESASHDWWGTLVDTQSNTGYHPCPWIYDEAINSGTVLYWMRENDVVVE